MSFLSRVASFAAMALALVGPVALSSPGQAEILSQSLSPAVAQAPLANQLSNEPLVQTVPAVVPFQPTAPAPIAASAPAEPSYATLEAAVAAQSVPDSAGEDLRCLAAAVYHEAKGEPLAGQLAVADVILNRMGSGRFPKSVCSVVKQPGQFSFVRGGQLPDLDTGRPAYRTALAVAQVALNAKWDSPAPAALYFHAKTSNASWGRPRVTSIGHHIFYR
jgi:N-acetylmuramoyl-L-alanine amidase